MSGANRQTSKHRSLPAQSRLDRNFARVRRDSPGAVVRRAAVFLAFAAGLLLTNCKGFERDRGLNPIIQASDVEIATQNQMRILNALAIDFNVSEAGNSRWYDVSLAGFNYVDDECRLYFNDLFFLNRENNEIKTGLAAAGATAAAVMGVTGATTKSISIVAQAFGLGAVATDLVAGTFLYQVPPATALGFVKELQLAYRSGIADRRSMINSPSASYHAIQDYLSLCLPPTIEAKIAENISSARVAPDPVTASAGPSFGLNVVSLPQVSRADVKAAAGVAQNAGPPRATGASEAPLTSSKQVANRERAKPPDVPDFSSIVDSGNPGLITLTNLQNVQDALCVPLTESGKVGPLTKLNIQFFEQSFFTNPKLRKGKLTPTEVKDIEDTGRCPSGAQNYFEKITYPAGASGQRAVQDLAAGLNAVEPEKNLLTNIPSLTTINDAVRAKMKSVRAKSKSLQQDVPTQVTPDLLDFLADAPRPK